MKKTLLPLLHVTLLLLPSVLPLSVASLSAHDFSIDGFVSDYSLYTRFFAPEKLYLHLDRTYYTSGETIWFNGILRNASRLTEKECSNFIYVELQDGNGTDILRIKVKRHGFGFPGSLVLPETLETGSYTVRAYTLSQIDGDPEYMFNQSIDILGAGNRRELTEKEDSQDVVDVSFYPEGGRWFYGSLSVIAFKLMDARGRSVELQAEIVDQDGNLVTSVSTVHDGMGRITLFPMEGSTYFLKLPDGSKSRLPDPSSSGVSISLTHLQEKICIGVNGADLDGEPGTSGKYSLLLKDAEMARIVGEVIPGGGRRQFVVNRKLLNPGINHLLVIDSQGRIISERLFFVYGSDTASCSVTQYGNAGEARSLLSAKISVRGPDGSPLDANCSVSVVRGSLSRHCQSDNLLSYMGLTSELRGRVNNPSWYFDPSVPQKERETALDLLMMVQGWSYYNIDWMGHKDRKISVPEHAREYVQSVKGRIERLLGKKTPKKFTLFVWIPQQKSSVFVHVDEGRRFSMDSLDFCENTGFLIKVVREEEGIDYIPKWEGDTFAPDYKYFPAAGLSAAVPADDGIPLTVETVTDTLQAAVITAGEDSEGLMSGHGVSRSELELYRDRNLIEYIGMKVPSFKYDQGGMYNTQNTVFRSGATVSSDEEGTVTDADEPGEGDVKLVVDGSVQDWWMFEDLLLEDVAAISISRMADTFYGAGGGVVSLRLRSGANIGRSSETELSLTYFVPLGYQVPDLFYAPRYDRGDVFDDFDHRNTIYWNPSVRIDGGNAVVRFCNTDQMDLPYLLRAEGLTSDGRPFSVSQLITD